MKMKTIISTEEAKGKTVSEIASNWNNFAIHFTDDSCIVFTAEHGREGDISVDTPEIGNIEDNELLGLKIITQEDYNIREKVRLKEEEERLYKRYTELKTLFEGGEQS